MNIHAISQNIGKKVYVNQPNGDGNIIFCGGYTLRWLSSSSGEKYTLTLHENGNPYDEFGDVCLMDKDGNKFSVYYQHISVCVGQL